MLKKRQETISRKNNALENYNDKDWCIQDKFFYMKNIKNNRVLRRT